MSLTEAPPGLTSRSICVFSVPTMPQDEYIPTAYEVDSSKSASASNISLQSAEVGHPAVSFTFEAIRPGLFRTTFTSIEHPLPPRSSVMRPQPTTYANGNGTDGAGVRGAFKEIHNGNAVATIDWSGPPIVSVRLSNATEPLYADLPNRSYCIDNTGIANYTTYNRNTLHVGLGEKHAPLNLSNRKFVIDATDCFGYDA